MVAPDQEPSTWSSAIAPFFGVFLGQMLRGSAIRAPSRTATKRETLAQAAKCDVTNFD